MDAPPTQTPPGPACTKSYNGMLGKKNPHILHQMHKSINAINPNPVKKRVPKTNKPTR